MLGSPPLARRRWRLCPTGPGAIKLAPVILRRAARILLVDADERVLLFRGFDPDRPDTRYWFTPGGGLDAEEPPAVGAARELAEETGLVLAPEEFGAPVWQDVTEFGFAGLAYQQEQDFFLVRVPRMRIATDGFDELERSSIDSYRWWTVAELEDTADAYYPVELPALLRRLLPC